MCVSKTTRMDTDLIFRNSTKEELELVLREIMKMACSSHSFLYNDIKSNKEVDPTGVAGGLNLHYLEKLLPLFKKDPNAKDFVEFMLELIHKVDTELLQ